MRLTPPVSRGLSARGSPLVLGDTAPILASCVILRRPSLDVQRRLISHSLPNGAPIATPRRFRRPVDHNGPLRTDPDAMAVLGPASTVEGGTQPSGKLRIPSNAQGATGPTGAEG
jgi:hypothetical protein